jgi:hypothetical protein
MIIYLLIGLLWALFFEWILRNFSDDGEGLQTHRARLFHIFIWPIAIYLVIKTQFKK